MRRDVHSIPRTVGVWLIIIIGSISINCDGALSVSSDLPCAYLDSINITSGVPQPDTSSIIFNGTEFTQDQYAQITYELVNGTKYVEVEPYLRGCLCKIKPCIRLCCPYGTIYGPKKKCIAHEAATQFEHKIHAENDDVKNRLVNHSFGYVHDRPCSKFYLAQNYSISYTGNVRFDNKLVPHHEYCLNIAYNAAENTSNVQMVMCLPTEVVETRFNILPYSMLLSVPFIVATILVYICLPELRNLHGKCLLCYLFGLVIGYFILAMVQLNGRNYVEPFLCKTVGYLIYFSFMSAFLWLNVISFDLWWIFRTTNGVFIYTEKRRFILYMLYAWGVSLFLTCVVFIVDLISTIPVDFRPNIGVSTCFLPRKSKSQLVFFYCPLIIICTTNLILFIITAFRIRKAKLDLKKVTSQEESKRHQSRFNTDKDSFTLYARLFIVMGVTWTMEGVSYLISEDSNYFLLTDICNTSQGVLIFALFVMKRRVLSLIKKRWQGCFGSTNESVTTNSTTATYAPSNIVLNNITSLNEKSKGSF